MREGGREGRKKDLTNISCCLESLHVRDGQGGNLDVDPTDFTAGVGGLDAAQLEKQEGEREGGGGRGGGKEERRVCEGEDRPYVNTELQQSRLRALSF